MARSIRKGSSPCKPVSSKTGIRQNALAAGWTSANWSGYAVKKTKKNSCRSISAYWRVPRIRASESDKYSSTWIGIDGFGNSSLIQTGTEQHYKNGKAHYYAWWEILPAAETRIPHKVSAGDWMYASISRRSGANRWRIVLANRTQGWVFSKTVAYSGPALTAEWIMEAPSLNNQITNLAKYTRLPFTRCRLNRSNPRLKSAQRGVMVQNGKTVSTPSLPSKSKDGFFAAYGSRTPRPPK
ncbi:G1 family endopeptidase [Paenibacillus doosanensis]|uniref:Peptidase A4 family protein n=1 Tax=Paenibacillus konkukensis TaxID=2020716 RepID=A0ABY4RW79_9BACL|nr:MULTISPECIES: G1 family glutamic endopeptidase [Paenibacillus]MCS7460950.1 G1 family endopeptidase [Paenibacillus doosanensis]UQZ85619.1 Peptidase A4 family protein [Paenibacillus konkukensis]